VWDRTGTGGSVGRKKGGTPRGPEDQNAARRKRFMFILGQNIPSELTGLARWVLWRSEQDTKVAYQLTGRKASSTNPRHWTRYRDARDAFQSQSVRSDGIAYVFVASDPYLGYDLDDVWGSDADEDPESWAMEILERFRDSYWEESPSGLGVKGWVRAELPGHRGRQWKIGRGAIELYDTSRYFCVTGKAGGPPVITDHQSDIDSLVRYLDSGDRRLPTPVAIGNKIPYGTQHNTLVSLAGSMHRRGMSVEAIEAALQVVNAQQCERPGPPENIRRIAESMSRYSR
jgi:hypothetical protein